jgi:beta-glucanase (GH16 family)
MYRYTVLMAGVANSCGGAQWAAGPYVGGGWEPGILSTMQALGALIAPVAPSIKNTYASTSYVTPADSTIDTLSLFVQGGWGGVATKSTNNNIEYIHVLTPPLTGSTLNLPAPADNKIFSSAQLVVNGQPVTLVQKSTGVTLTLTGTNTWSSLDTVIAMTVSGIGPFTSGQLPVVSPPVSQTVFAGQNVTFNVYAGSATTLSYQWQATNSASGGYTNISGATASTLALNSVSASVAPAYQVIVHNSAGSVTSTPAALLTLQTLPVITSQPASSSVVISRTAAFSVGVSWPATSGALSYLWQTNGGSGWGNLVNGGQISGADTNVLAIASVSSNWALSYQAIVSNGYGSVTSSPAILTLLPASPLVDVQFNGSYNFATATATPGPIQTGAAILGAGGDQWNIESFAYYSSPVSVFSAVPLTNADGTSIGATLTVSQPSNPVYTGTYPGSSYGAVDVGIANLMSSGLETFNNATFPGYINFSIGGLSAYTNSGFTLVVYAGSHLAQTETITLTGGAAGGNTGSALTTGSTSRQLSAGAGVAYNTFTGVLTGGILTFQVAGGVLQNSTLLVNGFQLQLTTNAPPVITTQPASQTVFNGLAASFGVGAAGSAPLSYQWQVGPVGGPYTNLVNGGPIAGVNSSLLSITNVTAMWNLTYQVIVSNSFGAVTSAPPALLLSSSAATSINLVNNSFESQVISGPGGTAGNPTGWSTTGSQTYSGNAFVPETVYPGTERFPTLPPPGLNGNNCAELVTLNAGIYGFIYLDTGVKWTPGITYQLTAAFGRGTLSYPNNPNFGFRDSSFNPISVQTVTAASLTANQFKDVTLSYTATGNETNGNGAYGTPGDIIIVFYSPPGGGGTFWDFDNVRLVAVPPPSPPVITTAPASQTNAPGGTVTFSVTASGTTPFGYQWQATNSAAGGFTNLVKNSLIPAVTNSSLTISNVSASWAFAYRVIVTNSVGAATSAPPASLTLVSAPTITSQPLSQTNTAGSTVTLSVGATGSAPLSYQWQAGPVGGGTFTNLVNGGQISGVNSNILTITNLTASWALDYQVIVTNSSGAVTSSPAATLTMIVTTSIAIPNFSFESDSVNSGSYTIQTPTSWSTANGSGSVITAIIYPASGDTRFTTYPPPGLDGLHFAQIFMNGGSGGETVYQDLGSANKYQAGTTYTLTAYFGVQNGSTPPACQLVLYNSSLVPLASNNITGLTQNWFTNRSVSYTANGSEGGNGDVVIGVNESGAPSGSSCNFDKFSLVTSSVSKTLPSITTQPVSQTNVIGGTATFSVSAAGVGTLSYQWQANGGTGYTNLVNGGPISGATGSGVTISPVATNWALAYQVIVSNPNGSVTSSPPATLTVNVSPSIVTPPASQRVASGRNVSFNVAALGQAPLSYQWQAAGGSGYTNLINGGPISGATGASLTLSNATANWALNYRVIVSNSYGSVTSTPAATLTVDPATRLINADFDSGPTQTGAAVLGLSGDVWNSVTGSTGSLVVSANNLVNGVGLTLSDQGIYVDTGGSAMDAATTPLMQDYAFGSTSPTTVTVSLTGLTEYTNSAFTLEVYAAGDNSGQGATLTLTGATGGNSSATLTTTATSRQISAGPGVAYQTFTGIITNGTLNLTAAINAGQSFTVINGFQLQLSPLSDPTIWSGPTPVSQHAYPGDPVSFSVTVLGTAPFSYQWQAGSGGTFTNLVNGGFVLGASSNVLTLTNVTANSSPNYRVIVTNLNGSATSVVATLTVPSGWQLVWSDEFNGNSLDTTKWTAYVGNDTGGNVWYTGRTNNLYLKNGLLHLVAQSESSNGKSYTSAQVRTEFKYSKKYGLIVARMKMPAGQGFWPAFWALGTNYDYPTSSSLNWPYCGEIDMPESPGGLTSLVQGTIHYADVSGNDTFQTLQYTLPGGGATSDFHTYGIQWASNSIIWQVDGVNVQTWTSWGAASGPNSFPAPFNQPFFFLLQLAVSGAGDYGGAPNGSTPFPSEVQVDYVRVYDPVTATMPTVTVSPGVTNVQCGNGATLTANAAGTAPLGYQWYNNLTNPIAGATNATLVLTSLHYPQAGNYTVIVTNAAGAATNVSMLNIVDTISPVISQCVPAQSLTNGPGCSATLPDYTALLVAADNCSGTLNIVQVPAPGTSLSVGSYPVNFYVDDGNGNTNTCSTMVTVYDGNPPVIVSQPASLTNNINSAAAFTVVVTGCTSLSYQWYFGATPLANQTNSTLTLPAVGSADAGGYRVVITSAGGTTNSQVAGLTVLSQMPVIISGKNLADRTFQLTINGPSNQIYQVLGTTNLAPLPLWVPLVTNTFPGGLTNYIDTGATNFNLRVYRLQSP